MLDGMVGRAETPAQQGMHMLNAVAATGVTTLLLLLCAVVQA
jgi:hypothetical protein